MTKQIFYVAAILSDTELIINAGTKDGISLTSKFDILENDEETLVDPVTGETLDKFLRKKQRVYVKEIREKYCICTSIYTEQLPDTDTLDKFLSGNQFINRTIGKKMNVHKDEVKNIVSKYSFSTIHIKDRAELI